ncbi:hypothetical protein [Vreelandella utahensis]|uniref:hypothetical protein n=1 Tax=Vreelandella halophila TaxID=86177 RepID=UPI001179CD61|nr:hypothetical protein [Halomonas utahensis]
MVAGTQQQSFPQQNSIEPALARLGLTLQELESVPQAAYRAFSATSELHPLTFPGSAAWSDAVQALRAQLLTKGWEPKDVNNQPRVISDDQQFAITVSSGNPDTGIRFRCPQTRGVKGTQTRLGIATNAQSDLFETEKADQIRRELESTGERSEFWILLFYIDFSTKEIRWELSRPINIALNGKINDWAERIIMPPMAFETPEGATNPPIFYNGEASYDVNIPITPKDNE